MTDERQVLSDELFIAIDQHETEKVAALLAAGADSNDALSVEPQWRPLEAAIEELETGGDVAVVHLLLKHGADVNSWDVKRSLTPLHAAMFHVNLEVLRLLLDAGADPTTVSAECDVPLLWAVEQRSLEMAEMLLTAGADKTMNDYGGFCGFTPLGQAVKMLQPRMVELLLKAGADPDAVDEDGQNARENLPPLDESDEKLWHRTARLLVSR